jgi:hypothetical protein
MSCSRTSCILLNTRWAGALLGIALMLFSAAGGARQATRVSEEIQETEVACAEAILRTEQTRAPLLSAVRGVVRDVPRVAAVLRCQARTGHSEGHGHSLPNGLNAPLHC